MTTAGVPTVSIVINTLNRAGTLATTLDSLRWLRYPGRFEVVVVEGPSTDSTPAVLSQWTGRIKHESCPVANLSISRNIGIAAAAGEVVAFIDDDAVPEPEWLEELMTAYLEPEVGAAGGFVFDYTGRAYQATFSSFNRFGDPVDSHGIAARWFVFPYSFVFPHLIGTNTSFRRDALVEVGGFDEEYEYYLDDTDVAVRVMDAGYQIEQVAGAHVHHKFAPSNIRDLTRVARDRYSVLKNRTYFSQRHAAAFVSEPELRHEQEAFVERHAGEMTDALARGLVSEDDVAAFDRYRDRALEVGRRAAERGHPLIVGEDWRERATAPFLPFETLGGDTAERVVLVATRPDRSDHLVERAREIARAGGIPHVIRATGDPSNIDFRDGVWLHNLYRGGYRWRGLAEAERDAVLRRFPDAAVG